MIHRQQHMQHVNKQHNTQTHPQQHHHNNTETKHILIYKQTTKSNATTITNTMNIQICINKTNTNTHTQHNVYIEDFLTIT